VPRKRKLKFENKKDPDQRRAPKCFSIPLREDGEVEGKANIWDVKPGESLVLNVWHDGEITAFIEKDTE